MADDTQLFVNNWASTVADATVAVDATTINIASADSAVLGAIAANEYFAATLSDGSALEIVWITANDQVGGLTVIRAREGTDALSFVIGNMIEIRNTKGTYQNFVQRDAAETLTQKTLVAPVLTAGLTVSITPVTTATYDLLITDYILHVTYTTTGPVTSLTLPTVQCVDGRIIRVKDAGGNAGTNNVTIDTEGAETIDGEATFVLNSNRGAFTIYAYDGNWFVN